MPANQLARAEIIGPEGPLRHPAFCLGFLLMAPSSDYASSDYASSDYAVQAGLATELHHIVSGHACWTVGEATEERRSGDFILHPSPMRHAIRTAEESLLTIYIRTRSASSPPGFMP
jgi:mannose-6-phosphate isomerase-like protein (cupin superfamily)